MVFGNRIHESGSGCDSLRLGHSRVDERHYVLFSQQTVRLANHIGPRLLIAILAGLVNKALSDGYLKLLRFHTDRSRIKYTRML